MAIDEYLNLLPQETINRESKSYNGEKILTTNETIEFLKISRTTLWRLKKQGEMPYCIVSRRLIHFKLSEILNYVETKKVTVKQKDVKRYSRDRELLMASEGKRHKIDWNSIKVSIVPADRNNVNPHNPCAKLSRKERERDIVSIAARIWARAVKEKMLQNHEN